MIGAKALLATLRFDESGLIPAVVQDVDTQAVLMVAFMNGDALEATIATGRTHFWSRSRKRLWRKGETSGHEQIVEDLYVNCEQNTLLVAVRQIGAACHDGYPTCFYRRVFGDGSLHIVRDRWFDPAEGYAEDGKQVSVEELTRTWYGAYEHLRDNDLSAVSGTSDRLHDSGGRLSPRIADELEELAGVLTGEHRHGDIAEDLLLETSQSLYWLALVAVANGISWDDLRPDRALATTADHFSAPLAASLLRSEARIWAASMEKGSVLGARVHSSVALVAQACRSGGGSPVAAVRSDLEALQTKPYLADYFSTMARS